MKKRKKKIKPIKHEWRHIDAALLNDKLNEVIKVVNELTKGATENGEVDKKARYGYFSDL